MKAEKAERPRGGRDKGGKEGAADGREGANTDTSTTAAAAATVTRGKTWLAGLTPMRKWSAIAQFRRRTALPAWERGTYYFPLRVYLGGWKLAPFLGNWLGQLVGGIALYHVGNTGHHEHYSFMGYVCVMLCGASYAVLAALSTAK